MNKPETGDWYLSSGIYIEVGELAPDGRWAMIHCSVRRDTTMPPRPGGPEFYVHMWDKEQPTSDGVFPKDWTKLREVPDWVRPRDTSRQGWETPSQPGGSYRAYPDGSDRRHP
jgi:hypothetical protein